MSAQTDTRQTMEPNRPCHLQREVQSLTPFLLADGARGREREDKQRQYFFKECGAYRKKEASLCPFHFSLMMISISTLGRGSRPTLSLRHNYIVPKYPASSASPKYSRLKLGVSSIQLNLLFRMKHCRQTEKGKASLERFTMTESC